MPKKKIALFFASITLLAGSFPAFLYAGTISFATGGERFEKDMRSWKEIKMEHIVPQTLDYSCGPAAVATILTYHYDDKVAENEVITYLLLTCDLKKVKQRRGFSLLDLKKFAIARGYDAEGYKMDLDFLRRLNMPVLIPVNIRGYDHFVIFRGISGDRAVLADPVLGNETMLVSKFLKIWRSGIGFVIKKDGYIPVRSSLMLSDADGASLAEPVIVQRLLSESVLGRIYADGEFK
ncbi:MAG: C39 family peptidase [Candidatus Omnitrophota bacterium]|jgi:predicted double-glycine peptidase